LSLPPAAMAASWKALTVARSSEAKATWTAWPGSPWKNLELAAVYRVVVEAFWNVAEHSGARNMYLKIRRLDDLLLLRLRDDGRGFDPSNPPPAWASAICESAPGRSVQGST
jgi:signal transduction histidine kinase